MHLSGMLVRAGPQGLGTVLLGPDKFVFVCLFVYYLFIFCVGQFFSMSLKWLYRFVSKLSNNGVICCWPLYNPGAMASKASLPQDPN